MIEAPTRDVLAFVTDFLADDPSDDDLLAFKLPPDLQERVSYLLYLNRESELTCEQRHELNDYMRANRMMSTLKVKTGQRQREMVCEAQIAKEN